MKIELPYHNHPAMKMLCRAILKELRMEIFGALLLLVAGSVAFTVSYGQSWFLFMLSGLIMFFGIKYTWRALKVQHVEDSRFMKIIIHDPKQIVWVYTLVIQRMPFGFRFSRHGLMYFKLADGDEISVSMSEKQLKVVSRFLNRLLPHATFGFSNEKELQYRESPRSLLRDNEKRKFT